MSQTGQRQCVRNDDSHTITLHGTIHDVDVARWSHLVRDDDVGISHGYLRIRESLSDAEVCLLAARDTEERLAGAAYATMADSASRTFGRPSAQLINGDCLRLADQPDRTALDALVARWAAPEASRDGLAALRSTFESLLYPAVLVFTPVETRIAVEPSLPADRRRAVVADLVAALHRLADERRCRSVIVFGTGTTDAPLLDLLRARGYVSAQIGAAAAIPLDGLATLDDYFDGLHWRHRSRCRKELRKFLQAGFEVRELALRDWADEVAHLELAVLRKYGNDRELGWLKEMKAREAEHLADAVRVLGCFAGDRLVATVTYYASARRYTASTYGCDYELTAGTFTYFGLGYYLSVADAIARGAHELCLGFEAYPAKVHRGARLYPRQVHVWTPDERARSFTAGLLAQVDDRNQRFFDGMAQLAASA